jgi:hypothetical protein
VITTKINEQVKDMGRMVRELEAQHALFMSGRSGFKKRAQRARVLASKLGKSAKKYRKLSMDAIKNIDWL